MARRRINAPLILKELWENRQESNGTIFTVNAVNIASKIFNPPYRYLVELEGDGLIQRPALGEKSSWYKIVFPQDKLDNILAIIKAIDRPKSSPKETTITALNTDTTKKIIRDKKLVAQEKLVIILVDSENFFIPLIQTRENLDKHLEKISNKALSYGKVAFRFAFTKGNYDPRILRALWNHNFLPVCVPLGLKEKDTTDEVMKLVIQKLLRLMPEIETYIIVSEDKDFMPICNELKDSHKNVITVISSTASIENSNREVINSYSEVHDAEYEKIVKQFSTLISKILKKEPTETSEITNRRLLKFIALCVKGESDRGKTWSYHTMLNRIKDEIKSNDYLRNCRFLDQTINGAFQALVSNGIVMKVDDSLKRIRYYIFNKNFSDFMSLCEQFA